MRDALSTGDMKCQSGQSVQDKAEQISISGRKYHFSLKGEQICSMMSYLVDQWSMVFLFASLLSHMEITP